MCLRLKSCCCGTDLARGSKIIAWIGGVMAIMSLLSQFTVGNVINVLFTVGLCICLWYGAHHRKSAFLIVYLVFTGIGLVILGLMVVMTFVGYFFQDQIYEALVEFFKEMGPENPFKDMDEETIKSYIGIVLIVMFVILSIYEAVAYYCFAVVYSLHKEIQEEQNPTGAFQAMEKGKLDHY